jgi:hypothetical protein
LAVTVLGALGVLGALVALVALGFGAEVVATPGGVVLVGRLLVLGPVAAAGVRTALEARVGDAACRGGVVATRTCAGVRVASSAGVVGAGPVATAGSLVVERAGTTPAGATDPTAGPS